MAEQNENIQNELEFEDILPFDTTGGDTGLSARLKLKRNFDRIRAWADTIGVRLLGQYLSRVKDDTAEGRITFLKGLEAVGGVLVRGVLTAWEAVMNRVHSENYTDDTGFELTNDNGAGASQLTVDYIRARRKLIAESVEVKEYHASAGDEIFTGATAEISRVDYFDSEGNQLGVHRQKVPFTLNGVLLMLQKVMGTARLEPRGIASDSRAVRGALSAAERQRIARMRCYFLASDGERDVENWWAVGDLAYCKTQNLTRTPRDSRIGSSSKAGNVFWWRQVVGTDNVNENEDENENGNGNGAVTLEDGKEYHYIDFTVNYAEEQTGTYNNSAYLSDLPAPGDKCMQFGNVSNPDRMNAVMVEVNGTGNANAPDIVFYRGIYTYSLDRCWWGGESCRKAKLSPSTGWEFTGPDFKFITEYGQARVPVDRGAWLSIPEERDVREPHEAVRKCYYFDRVTHLGSLWLCVKADNYIWLKNEGTAESPVWNYWGTSDPRTQPDYSDDLYRRVLDYTTVEPSENAPTVWQKQVAKGETPVPVSAYQWNQSPTVVPSPLPTTGATLPTDGWTATAPARPGNGYYLWMTMCSRYGDGSYTPWGDAVCITGGQGSAGEDAKEREWIYTGKSEPTTFSGDTLPANIKKDVDGTTRTDDYIATTDDFVPQGWQDTAIAIDETANRYVYASWRVWDKQTQRWGSFQPPILWGNWGVKGEDGDGVQYVFRLFDHELTDTERDTTYKPTRQGLEPTQEGEWLPAGWSDDPLSTTSQMKWCYCSTIKRIGGEWGDFEKLALWSKWSEDGTSPWVADLDNEMDSVACDTDGHPTSEQTVMTGVSLVYGGERRNATVAVYKDRACEQPYTNSETMENGLAVYWTIGARSSHTVSVKVGSALTISGSMNFYVKITDGESGVFRLLVFTVNGMRPGADGQPATIYNLLPSENQVSVGRNTDGTYNPATFSLTCGYTKNVGGVMTTVPNVTEQIDGKYCLYYRLRNRSNQTWGTYRRYDTVFQPLSGVSVASYDQVEFVLSTEDAMIVTTMDANTVIDRETVPVVADGKQGEQGNNGDDAVTVRFSRNPVVFQGNSLGQSVNTTVVLVYPVVYVGGTPVDATSVVLKSKPSGLDVAVRNVAAEWDGVVTQPVAISPTGIGVAEGALTGIVELTIGYGDNKTITGSVVTTVAHSGTSGNGVKEIFKASDTKPATPSGTDVLPASWSEQPPVLTTGLTYSVTGDWTRSGNTLTSPATTADDGVYRSRVSFTTNGKATIAVRLTVSSEENYDIAAIAAADNNFLEGKTAGDIKDYSGTDLVAKLSGDGTTGVFLLTVDAAGPHYFDVVYAKDSSNDDYNDNAVLELNLETDIWVSTSKIVTDASGNETAAGWSEPVRWNGPQGKMGRNFYYDGVYDSSRTYSVTDYEAPFVSYGANYYVRVGEGSCQGVTPSAGSPYWELMTSTFKYLITGALFTEYAKLNSWVFNGDYMFSENDASGNARGNKRYYGIGDSRNQFTPSASIDGLTGRASFSGDNVRFNPDGSGWVAGQNIKWYANGSAEFSGKVTATSGSIAGFQINQDYLGTQDDGYTQGFVMTKQRLMYYYGGKGVSIGTNNNQAISVTDFSGATALFTDGGNVLHKLGANDSFTVGDASSVNTGETVILSKFEARGDVAIGGAVITDSSRTDYLPSAGNTRKGQLLLFSSGDWEIDTSSTVWIYNEDGRVTSNGGTFERTGPFMLVCVGFNSSNVALWQYFSGR